MCAVYREKIMFKNSFNIASQNLKIRCPTARAFSVPDGRLHTLWKGNEKRIDKTNKLSSLGHSLSLRLDEKSSRALCIDTQPGLKRFNSLKLSFMSSTEKSYCIHLIVVTSLCQTIFFSATFQASTSRYRRQ